MSRDDSARLKPLDATAALQVWLILLLVLPQRWVVPGIGAAGRPSVLFGLCLGGLYFATRLLPQPPEQDDRTPGLRWVAGALYAFLITVLLSYALSFNRPLAGHESSAGERELLVMSSMAGVALLASVGIPNRASLDRLLRTWCYLVSATAVIAMLQFYADVDLPAMFTPPGLTVHGGDLVRSAERATFRRAVGLTDHAIELSVLLAMTIPLVLHYLLHARERRERRKWILIAVVLGAALPLAVSRSGFVALGIGVLVLASVWNLRQQMVTLVGAIAVVALVQVTTPTMLGTIRSLFTGLENDTSITARTDDYEIAFRFVAQRPWFGRGAGSFGSDTFRLLDNQMLKSLIEIGRVGVGALFALFATALLVARATRTRAQSDEARHLGQAIAAVLWLSLASMFFADLFFYGMFTGLLFLTFGITGTLSRLRKRSTLTIDGGPHEHHVMRRHLRVESATESISERPSARQV